MPKARPDLAARMDRELAPPEPSTRPAARAAAASAQLGDAGEGRGPVYVPPSRQNMKRIQGYFSPRVKRQLRMLAAQSDKTEEQLVGEALNMLFQTHGLPAIAFESKEGAA
jgi:hypothetical protein